MIYHWFEISSIYTVYSILVLLFSLQFVSTIFKKYKFQDSKTEKVFKPSTDISLQTICNRNIWCIWKRTIFNRSWTHNFRRKVGVKNNPAFFSCSVSSKRVFILEIPCTFWRRCWTLKDLTNTCTSIRDIGNTVCFWRCCWTLKDLTNTCMSIRDIIQRKQINKTVKYYVGFYKVSKWNYLFNKLVKCS